MMVAPSGPYEIAKVVQDRLRRDAPATWFVRVLADEVRHGGDRTDWWYVPVAYQLDPNNAYKYFEAFSKIEEELEAESVNVLLVPRIVPPPSDSNS